MNKVPGGKKLGVGVPFWVLLWLRMQHQRVHQNVLISHGPDHRPGLGIQMHGVQAVHVLGLL